MWWLVCVGSEKGGFAAAAATTTTPDIDSEKRASRQHWIDFVKLRKKEGSPSCFWGLNSIQIPLSFFFNWHFVIHMSKFLSSCSRKCSSIGYYLNIFSPNLYVDYGNIIHLQWKFGLGSYARSKVSLVLRSTNRRPSCVESSKHSKMHFPMSWRFNSALTAICAGEHQWNIWSGITSKTKLSQQNGSHLQIQ